MAGRNIRRSADYFPHDADSSSDEKIIYLESVFGHTGYAVYFKFLEKMTRSKEFKLEWNNIKKAVYASEFGISVTEIDNFVTECCRNEIKAFIFEDGNLFSPGLIKRFQPLIDKREYNRKKYEENKANKSTELGNSVPVSGISVTEMTQESKGKESKGKESKGKNKTIFPKNFALDEDMKKYCIEKSITKKPDLMFEDFKNNHVSKGSKFVNWVSAWKTWCRNDAKFNQPKKGAMKKNGFTKEYYKKSKKSEPRKSYSELLQSRKL